MALPNDRHFREKYRGKNPLFLQAQLPQKQYLFKRKKIGSGLQDAIVLQKISIYHGSIVDDELIGDVDAAILPANERLWADGSGVCGAIFKKAGYDKLQKACHAITSQTDDHSIPNGQSVITKAFNLNVKYIIHAIAPCEQNNEDLISCYISALELCVKMGIRNVAFPCIGTGDGNFSKVAACSIALRCVRGWLCDANNVKFHDFMAKSKKKKWHKNIEYEQENDNEDIYKINDETVADRILNVVFCCYDDTNWNLYCQIMPKIFPADDEKYSYLWIDKMLHHIQSLETVNTLNYLHTMKERIDEFICYAQGIINYLSTISQPDVSKYRQWTLNDIATWILSLKNGRIAWSVLNLKKQKKKNVRYKCALPIIDENKAMEYGDTQIFVPNTTKNGSTLNPHAQIFVPNTKNTCSGMNKGINKTNDISNENFQVYTTQRINININYYI